MASPARVRNGCLPVSGLMTGHLERDSLAFRAAWIPSDCPYWVRRLEMRLAFHARLVSFLEIHQQVKVRRKG